MSERHQSAVLILSCDKYADIWTTFFAFFFKYWPDCPFTIYLASNEKQFEHDRVVTIRKGAQHRLLLGLGAEGILVPPQHEGWCVERSERRMRVRAFRHGSLVPRDGGRR